VARVKTNKLVNKLPKKSYKFDIGQALALRLNNGLSYEQIGKQLGVSNVAIYKGLKPFLEALSDPGAIQAFESNEPKLISAAKAKIFTQIVNDEVLKKASLNNLAYAYDKLNYVKRLEEDKSTANIAYADLSRRMKDIDDELAQYGIKVSDEEDQLEDDL